MNVINQAYSICIQAKVPVILWGLPATGKTSRTQAMARGLGWTMIEQVCSTWDPTDVGLPMMDRDGLMFRRVAPQWAHDCAEAGSKGILYLDEFSCTPPAVQAAALKIIGERKCGDFKLPDGLAIALSANPADIAAGGWDLAPPMANRMVHLDCTLPVEDWCEGMISGWPDEEVKVLPKGWRHGIAGKRALVTAYMRRFPTHLLDMPDDEASCGRAWPSPRSWDFLCTLLAAAESVDADPAVVMHLVKGSVGHPAISFLTFCEQLDLPDPETLLADPSLYVHPARGDKAHAILGSVSAAALSRPGKKRWEAAIQVMLSAAEQGGTDIAAIASKPLLKNQPAGATMSDDIVKFFPMYKLVRGW